MKYGKTELKCPVSIQNIISVHYFEYDKDFAFSGEMHDFWEFVYVDKGEFYVTADAREFLLRQGELYLHKPLEFHNVRMTGVTASNSVILSFSCDSPALFSIAGKRIACGNEEREMMANMIAEAQNAFCTPLGDPYTKKLRRREQQEFACEQLIKIYLELLLITLIRRGGRGAQHGEGLPRQHFSDAKCKEICDFLEESADGNLSFSEVCTRFSLSGSALKKLFHEKMGCGVMEFFNTCKINKAKELIREKTATFTEIAEMLGFSSVHYFSRRFKALTGMTPSQYAASVKAMQQEIREREARGYDS